jgi:hypothetical protein
MLMFSTIKIKLDKRMLIMKKNLKKEGIHYNG